MNEKWKECKLGDFITTNDNSINKIYHFKDIKYLDTGSITCNKISELQDFKLNEAPSRAKRLVQNDDIIYSTVRPNQLHYGFIKNPLQNLVVSTGFVVIRCNKEKINPQFLYYYLSSDYQVEYLHSIAEGSTSTYPSLKPSDIESLEITLPPLNEQKAIAEVLSSLDDKIDLLHRQNTTLEEMVETLFRQWFVEEADERWEEGKLSDIAIHSKKSIKPQQNLSKVYFHYSIPSFDKNKTPVRELGEEIQSNKYAIPKNSILFSKLNPHKDKRVWLIQNSLLENSICSTEFQVVLPKNEEYLYFTYGWLTLNNNYRELASGVGGTSGSHQRISPSIIFEFSCPIVPIEIVQAFNKIAKPIFEKQENNQTQIQTLETLRNTLLPKLMSGEIRVV